MNDPTSSSDNWPRYRATSATERWISVRSIYLDITRKLYDDCYISIFSDHQEERVPNYLRKSIFANVPPSINFQKDVSNRDAIPEFLQKYLCLQKLHWISEIQTDMLELNDVTIRQKCQHSIGKWIGTAQAGNVQKFTGTQKYTLYQI